MCVANIVPLGNLKLSFVFEVQEVSNFRFNLFLNVVKYLLELKKTY